jgi:itaconyl-CoA hydratase
MVATAKPVGENRLREGYGRYYEDFAIGEIYEHRPGRRSAKPTTLGSRCSR